MEATWFNPDGGQHHGKGEWHFAWVLGGRGIQDVLFANGAPSHQYGTTLRCYDPAQGLWNITWMQSYGGEFVNLVGRQMDNRIVNEGVGSDSNRRQRWSFSEIKPHSFLCRGEVFRDETKEWFLEQEMRGYRFVD